MSSTKSFINTFMLTIATLAIVSCVPKATEKKAVCGTNEAFSTVSRSCYSIEELRVKPVGTTATVSMSEEIFQTITLAYTDGNKDKAISCRVSSIATNLEMISPSLADGGLFAKADEVEQAAQGVAAEFSASDVAMLNALLKAKASSYYPTVVAQLNIFKAQATALLALGTGSSDPIVQSWFVEGQKRMLVFTTMITNMNNRCECISGICKTVAIPKLNKTGTTGFTYSVTDVDGEGGAKVVSGTISAMLSPKNAHLKPVATSSQETFEESLNNTGRTSDFTILDGGDISNTTVSAFLYKFKTNGTTYTKTYGSVPGASPAVTTWYGLTPKGYVYSCMDLNATGPSLASSVATNDRTCKYVPISGNDWDSLHTDAVHANASRVIGSAPTGLLTYTAIAPGTAGNNISIQYFNLREDNNRSIEDAHIIFPEVYGMVGASDEAFIRVLGNKIKVFINPGVTSTAQIQALMTAHKQANKLVTVTGGSPSSYPSPSVDTLSAVSLAGGAAAYDQIPYTITNAIGDSENDGVVSVRVTRADDTPILGVAGFITVDEDKAIDVGQTRSIVINLKPTYDDNDTDGVNYTNSCAINMSTVDLYNGAKIFSDYFNAGTARCTCTGVNCTAELDPFTDVSRDITQPFNFSYTITSTDNTKSPAVSISTASASYGIRITPINDAPQISTSVLPTITNVLPQTILENGNGYVDVYIGPGGGGYESQTLTLTATSSNTTVLPNANIVITDTVVGVTTRKRITYTPVAAQSGSVTVNLSLVDSGSSTLPNVNTTLRSFSLTVTPVNNPPVFKSTITKIETNEGGAVQSDGFEVDEDASGSSDENAQSIRIIGITSDNHNVLPPSAIKIFYDVNDNGVEDSGEARAIGDVLEGPLATDNLKNVRDHKFYLKLDPVDGISGNANITLTIQDTIESNDPKVADPTYLPLTNPASTTFSFIVHPVAALHGGWTNLSSVGIKTDKQGTPVSQALIQCNYNKKATSTFAGDLNKCAGEDCTKGYSPTGTIVPDAANVIFWDSAAQKCYRSTANNAYSWVDFNTSCPVTRTSAALDQCSGNNCIHDVNPSDPTEPFDSLVATLTGQYHYNLHNNTCYVSTGTQSADQWEVYSPSSITLAWKPFVMVGSGGSISVQTAGWNVYRREAGTDYNFKGGHLKNTSSNATYTITDPSIRTFTDTTAIAGKVYYYVVRPVDNLRQFPTYTPELFSEARVLASPANYSFVHRWIVNQEVCNSMNITTTTSPSHVDQTNNFRCEYSGPGQTVDGNGNKFYDYGQDLLVDTQEAGCPYAAAPKCTANGCIGTVAPSNSWTVDAEDLYYNRNSGICYVSDGAAWLPMGNTGHPLTPALTNKLNSALNPPLVNVTQLRSLSICSTRDVPTLQSMTLSGPVSLPNKKEYIGYASQKLNVTDTEITEMEQGYSLNIQSRCNSSNASGIETAYTDSSIPSTSFIYSIPGTFSSGIRSLYTGSIPWGTSKGTEACVSRFGIQDLYGNVAEWTADQMGCEKTNFQCRALATTASNVQTYTVVGGVKTASTTWNFPANARSSFTATDFNASTIYGFDLKTGPFNDLVSGVANPGDPDLTGPSPGDAFLTQWIFGDQFFGATKFSLPLGLPISSDSQVPTILSAVFDHFLTIGPSSGITTNKLHDDGIIVNGSLIAPSTAGTGSFAVGGSYLSGSLSGRYTSELIESSTARSDVGLRCIIPIGKTEYPVDTNHTYPY